MTASTVERMAGPAERSAQTRHVQGARDLLLSALPPTVHKMAAKQTLPDLVRVVLDLHWRNTRELAETRRAILTELCERSRDQLELEDAYAPELFRRLMKELGG